MRNIRLLMEYDGTRYRGWQRPKNAAASGTISGKLTETLSRITAEEITLFCGAKTETGVHAARQTANFHTESSLSAQEILQKLNLYLPRDIVILSAEEVPERFHAELNALSRTYLCRISTSAEFHLFTRRYTCLASSRPDLLSMQDAARLLVGRHDFTNFSLANKKRPIETELFTVQVTKISPQEIQILMEGSRFLRRMPQCIAGTLLDIGCQKRPPACIEQIFAGTETPGTPCPSHALRLEYISYPALP